MFIAEIEPYKKYIDLFLKGQGVPNHDILRKIADIYDEWIRDKAFKEPSCIGCSNVVKHMMLQLSGAIEREGNKPIKLEPKIPKLKPKKIKLADGHYISDIATTGDLLPSDRVVSLKWGAFKSYCKEQGINVKGKTKVQLLEELGIES